MKRLSSKIFNEVKRLDLSIKELKELSEAILDLAVTKAKKDVRRRIKCHVGRPKNLMEEK